MESDFPPQEGQDSPPMLLQDALAELLLVKDYTPHSAIRRQETLSDFFAWCANQGVITAEGVTKEIVRGYFAYLRERENKRTGGKLSSETQHGQASIVRMFVRFCAEEGWTEEVKKFNMPRRAQKVVQVFSLEHIQRLLRATELEPMLAFRDRAIITVLLDTGVRAEELCTLTVQHLQLAPKESFIRVEGKGRKQREVGLGKQATLALHRYLTHRKRNSHLVFLNRAHQLLTPNAIDRTLYRLRDIAGKKHFDGIRVSAHTFRHSFAVHFMQQGGDVYKLSRLLGHESVSTTERYLRAFNARDARLTSKSVLDNL